MKVQYLLLVSLNVENAGRFEDYFQVNGFHFVCLKVDAAKMLEDILSKSNSFYFVYLIVEDA